MKENGNVNIENEMEKFGKSFKFEK